MKFLVEPRKEMRRLNLKKWDPNYDAGKRKEDVEDELVHISSRMSDLQYKLFAAKRQPILIILQGVDASGKDGTIRQVMGALNPQNCYVKSFEVPNEEELSHDYLWRIHKVLPSNGQIAIFNRSHYEDVIEPRVNNLISRNEIIQRYKQINDFERYLSENHITLLKFFLHISKDEQKKRIKERINNPTKRWKISESDLLVTKYWNKYIESYEQALSQCSTRFAPWYIIPANVKWFRNWVIARTIVSRLEEMNLEYPQPKIDVSKLRLWSHV